MVIHRGDIWWADLAEPRGSEPGHRRPVLVVQQDLLTASALSTVMVVPLTSKMERGKAIGNVALTAAETGLPKDSVALVCQLVTADKAWLTKLAGTLSRRRMNRIDEGLSIALGLE